MSLFSQYFYSQTLFPYAVKAMEFLTGSALYAGSRLFSYLEIYYISNFDGTHRQIKAGCINELEGRATPDKWEDPEIVGENRCNAHTVLRSFRSIENALAFWSNGDVDEQQFCHKLLLTGRPGLPDATKVWQFLLVGCPSDAPNGWQLHGLDVSKDNWATVALPAHWQCLGFDTPIYTNTVYPFRFDPPRARRDGAWAETMCDTGISSSLPDPTHSTYDAVGVNATGLYRHAFFLPEDWENEEVEGNCNRYFLVFEGVDSAFLVWLDGKYVGYSQDSCLPAEFDITDILVESGFDETGSFSHLLSCQVMRWSDGSYLEDQDKWWLSGIYREVYIIKKPAFQRIADYEFGYSLNWSENSDAVSVDFEVDILVEGNSSSLTSRASCIESKITAQVFDADGALIYVNVATVPHLTPTSTTESSTSTNSLPRVLLAEREVNSRVSDRKIASHGYDSAVVSVRGSLVSPRLWSAENPYLYIVVLSLKSGPSFDHEACRIGFREVRIGGPWNTLQVNRQTITIAGINRNEFDSKNGRSVSKATMLKDVMILKQLNFNAIRTSHYPSHHYLLELCDAAGLYVVDEANIETHGFQVLGQAVGYLSNKREWLGAHMARLARMIERDKNFSCVIGWSLGNESGTGPSHDAMASWMRIRDISGRFLQYESGGSCTHLTNIVCPMYRRPDWCEDRAVNDPLQRPVILCEYAHTMGNSAGGLHHYWSLFHSQRCPRLQGGFIWDMVDQGLNIERNEMLSNKIFARSKPYKYGGDFGDFPNSKQFCINGILGPDRDLHPIAFEAACLQSPISFELFEMKPSNEIYLVVNNRRKFSDLSDVTLKLRLGCNKYVACGCPVEVTLRLDNTVVASGKITLQLKAYWSDLMQSMMEQRVGENYFCIEDFEDAWLNINATTNVSTPYVPSGHSIVHLSLRHERLKSLVYQCIRAASEGPMQSLVAADYDEYDYGRLSVRRMTPKQKARARAAFLSRSMQTHPKRNDIFWSKWSEFEEAHGDENTFRDMVNVMKSIEEEYGCGELTVSSATQDDGNIVVSWTNGSHAILSAGCGRLISWMINDCASQKELLKSPLDICFWRAPTDNDRGGAVFSYFSQWKAFGLNSLARAENSVTLRIINVGSTDVVAVEAKWVLESNLSTDCVIKTQVACSIVYTFKRDGSVDFRFTSVLPKNVPPLPRFGLRFSIPSEFTTAVWYGLGPHEAYDDRMSCVTTGLFSSAIEDMHTPYVVPQESGRRAEPKVIELSDPLSKRKLVIKPMLGEGSKGWGWSASKYSLENLESSSHNYELVLNCADEIHIHIDRYSMGLGGYDSWSPNVREDFLIQGGRSVQGEITICPVIYKART